MLVDTFFVIGTPLDKEFVTYLLSGLGLVYESFVPSLLGQIQFLSKSSIIYFSSIKPHYPQLKTHQPIFSI